MNETLSTIAHRCDHLLTGIDHLPSSSPTMTPAEIRTRRRSLKLTLAALGAELQKTARQLQRDPVPTFSRSALSNWERPAGESTHRIGAESLVYLRLTFERIEKERAAPASTGRKSRRKLV